MSDEAAFLEVLKANPADDTARLVYADWLDEHDEPLKAEYLRLTHAYVTEEEGELVPVGRILALGEQYPRTGGWPRRGGSISSSTRMGTAGSSG